ncbi:hypothetical protein [Pseudomonas songnenensis]|jgi:hypothetical protein|uniref:Uncharacterized protein n=1 Tax=Pseudomonas songnenensis TaxID=1176259 RepID=A0A482U6Y3_9PSED|nr:hypothetical protein [Pseudomonas songnenensis]AWM59746.1 hypothetical protein C6Y58_09715 [Stutzerimonas stutzeri]RYJ60837.1 hypothetical protein EJA06_019240 [Pseudomonas songnenensis]
MSSHTFSRSRFLLAHAWPALLGLLLSGCSALGSVGADTFTLEGELPADFALEAQAHYGVANGCNGRARTRSFESDFEDRPHAYRFRIPVNYRDGLCEMRLARVGLFINGRYGDKDWQRTYDNGGLELVDALPEGAPRFDGNGRLSKTAKCTWFFQLSRAHSRKGEISKLLSCSGAGAYLANQTLPGKFVNLSFQVQQEERPARRNTWLSTAQGWKPCVPKEGWQQCQEPPVFGTFRMDGRECTVYPNCKE